MALATPDDLAAWLQLADADALPVGASRMLDLASAAVVSYCEWPLLEETVTDLVLDGNGSRKLKLPTLRLTAVGEVALWDTTAEDYAQVLVDRVDFDWSGAGVLTRWCGWPWRPRWVRTSFTHGWPAEDLPEVIVGTVCAVAARQVVNPAAVRSKTTTIGAYAEGVVYAIPGSGEATTLTLTAAEQDVLEQYRLEPGS